MDFFGSRKSNLREEEIKKCRKVCSAIGVMVTCAVKAIKDLEN